MSGYQALYRAWRPETFGEVCGQETVTRTLKKQVESGHISHAYLFCGSRGTGKTSSAKVLARAINCLSPVEGEPCGKCAACEALKNESSLDVLEIDAASNNGVDEVRLLRDRIAYPPTVGRYKVYIIDEVHMLSTGAFNALLKTLEEPPAHAVFILATTEPNKLPATVLSRCQRYDFKRISVKDIIGRMQVVLEGIGRECAPDALEEIAVAADGGMRDALSLLDMCLGYTDERVEAKLVREVLGSTGREFMFEFTDAIEKGDAKTALTMIDTAMRDGRDPSMFARETASHMRTILMAQTVGNQLEDIAQITKEAAERFALQGQKFEPTRLMRAMDMFIHAESDMKYVSMPRSVLEMIAVKACRVSNEKSVEALSERIEALEKQLKEGVVIKSEAPSPQKAPEAPTAKVASPVSPKPQPVQAPADNSPDKQAYDAGIEAFLKLTPSARVFMASASYQKTEDDVVYVTFPRSATIHKQVIEKKAAEIEQHLAQSFGRGVKLNVAIDDGKSNQKPGVSGSTLSQTFDIFGRDKVELVD